MPIKLDISRAWKWCSSVKAQDTQPIGGKRGKVDHLTPRSPGDTKPPPAQFGKMKEPLWNASNSVKGLFRWRSPPGSRYGNGKRKFGGRLVVPRDTLDDQVTITPRAGHLRLEDLRRELGRRELEEGGSEMRIRQRSPADSAYCASDDELRDPFEDPSREGSQLSRWSTAGSLISKTHALNGSQLP